MTGTELPAEIYFSEVAKAKYPIEYIEAVTIGLKVSHSHYFPLQCVGFNCTVLIDTGASHSCLSETFYKQVMLPKMQQIFHLFVTSASGKTISPLETVKCSFDLRGHSFEF